MKHSKTDIIKALREYLDRTGTSQNTAAKQMGVSGATLSNILSGKSQAGQVTVSDDIWNSIAAYVLPGEWKLVETTNLATIFEECRECQQGLMMRAIIGPSGFGKTTALRRYKLDNPNTFYVLCQADMNSKELLKAIAMELGIEQEGTKYAMIRMVAMRLQSMDHPLLMLDDAGKLSGNKMHLVQQIYDLVENQAGIILSAVDYMYDNLVKGVRRSKMGYPELRSRLGAFRRLRKPSPKQMEEVARVNGITDDVLLRWIKGNCPNLRSVRQVVLDCKRYEQRHNQLMSELELEELHKDQPLVA